MTKITSLIFLLTTYTLTYTVQAQMTRERATVDGPVESTFWAPNIVGLETVEQLAQSNMNVTIMHSFGLATNRPLRNFFGMDIAPNVRLGIDYGITDNWSLGVGRTTFEKVIDIRTKLAVLRQTQSDDIPISLSLKGDVGLTTQENNQPLEEDLNYLASVLVARKFSDHFSLQLSPMFAHFNSLLVPDDQVPNLYAVGLGAEYHLSDRYALSGEYYPILSQRNKGTVNPFALALNIETGGHVFQLFFASSNWHTEQYILARNTHQFWKGDFRFGFNVNRLFFLGDI